MHKNLFVFFLMITFSLLNAEEKTASSHPLPPFESYITGVGIVEASSENISIGIPIQRIVNRVAVNVDSDIKKGQELIILDNRDLEADLNARKVAYDIAISKVKKLEAYPRPEDVSSAVAALKTAETDYTFAKHQFEQVEGLRDIRAISQEEYNRRSLNLHTAEAKLDQAKINLDKIKQGTWKPDLDIAKLEAQLALANLERAQADYERTIIRSPIDGKVLQIKIHEGEFPPMDTFNNPIMIVGNTNEKYLNVSINQYNASMFKPNAPALAFLQGNPRKKYPLDFVKLEPLLVQKENLSNALTEKVDTRVLRVTYKFKENPENIFVGQQMDVFIKTDKEK